jgi:acylphosphatase
MRVLLGGTRTSARRMAKRIHIIVRGVVQGVGFRIFARDEASRLGLRGYVHNRAEGSVEIIAEGPTDAVEQLIVWAKHGSAAAVVENLRVAYGEPTGEFSDFTIRG